MINIVERFLIIKAIYIFLLKGCMALPFGIIA